MCLTSIPNIAMAWNTGTHFATVEAMAREVRRLAEKTGKYGLCFDFMYTLQIVYVNKFALFGQRKNQSFIPLAFNRFLDADKRESRLGKQVKLAFFRNDC